MCKDLLHRLYTAENTHCDADLLNLCLPDKILTPSAFGKWCVFTCRCEEQNGCYIKLLRDTDFIHALDVTICGIVTIQ